MIKSRRPPQGAKALSRIFYMALNETLDKEIHMKKVTDRIKQAWEENPLAVIVVGTFAANAASKLLDAHTARKNSQTWEMEVARRRMMK